MTNLKRWTELNYLFLIAIAFIAIFAYADAQQIQFVYAMHNTDKWQVYEQFTLPAIWMLWGGILCAIGLIWYIIKKDKSEAIALVLAPATMLFFGLEDALFFLFSPVKMAQCMDWFDYFPHTFFQKLLGISCTNPTALFLSAGVGIVAGYFIFRKLKEV